MAFYVGLNIEHFEVDKPSTSIFGGTAMLVPDPLNFGWRDYSVRVSVWRMMDALDKVGMRASVLLNSDVCEQYPQIIAAGKERNWLATPPGRGYFAILRLYAPTEAAFDRTWKAGDFEKID